MPCWEPRCWQSTMWCHDSVKPLQESAPVSLNPPYSQFTVNRSHFLLLHRSARRVFMGMTKYTFVHNMPWVFTDNRVQTCLAKLLWIIQYWTLRKQNALPLFWLPTQLLIKTPEMQPKTSPACVSRCLCWALLSAGLFLHWSDPEPAEEKNTNPTLEL